MKQGQRVSFAERTEVIKAFYIVDGKLRSCNGHFRDKPIQRHLRIIFFGVAVYRLDKFGNFRGFKGKARRFCVPSEFYRIFRYFVEHSKQREAVYASSASPRQTAFFRNDEDGFSVAVKKS